MFGDGASNTGNFGETMNLAALWKLPVLFLVENNLYGMGTSVERHSAQTDLSKKAEGYGIPGERVDGMDVIAVREAVAEGIRLAREEHRPTLLEAFTYRYRGHSAADPEVYREREEVEEWREKDPIETFARRCVEAGVLGEREVQEVARQGRGGGGGGGRVRRGLARAGARHALREPLRARQRRRLVRGRRAQPRAAPRRARGGAMPDAARELAEAGAAYAGQPARAAARTRRSTATPQEGSEPEVAGEVERAEERRGGED